VIGKFCTTLLFGGHSSSVTKKCKLAQKAGLQIKCKFVLELSYS